MPKVHFIAIGGSVMHNLAIALYKKGYQVTGSDDHIFDPARNRLAEYAMLPEAEGWFPEKIHTGLDAVIVGMHARADNPELLKARTLGIKILSFPEYLYEQTQHKKRIVIGGSHGKTTITSMIMHVLKDHGHHFDYMVGARLEGFETMVGLSDHSSMAILEGDEYLSSPCDTRPKFHLYQPHMALISGIAWDHINVFPTFDKYIEQFRIFIDKIQPNGTLIYYKYDKTLQALLPRVRQDIRKIPYSAHPAGVSQQQNILYTPENKEIPIQVFGNHNLANISGALLVCKELGIQEKAFYHSIRHFSGASGRLELLAQNAHTCIYLDFAHAPSKLEATIAALKQKYPQRDLIAILELHTFSSLNKAFLKQYHGKMRQAEVPVVFYNPENIKQKNLEPFDTDYVKKAFDQPDLSVFQSNEKMVAALKSYPLHNQIWLFMTSGNFNGINLKALASDLLHNDQ